MEKEIISSSKNEKIKTISALLKSKKARDEHGAFVIEGIRLFRDTLRTAPEYLESVFVSESFLIKSGDINTNIDRIKDSVPIYTVKDSVFDGISDTVTTQGVLAIVRKPEYTLKNILNGTYFSRDCQKSESGGKSSGILQDKARFLILENIQDPGNLGTMLRTAEAAGMSAIIMSPDCTDIFSPKVVRSSMGSIFRMPFIYCGDFLEALGKIKEEKVKIYAAYLRGGISYREAEFGDRYAILIGNEGNGLTDAAVNEADQRIFIPMAGEIESLNAAVAAAILMYK